MKHWPRIRRGSLSVVLVGMVIAFTATPALAVTPTFTVAPPTGENTNGNLTMTFTGVGLSVADGADSALLHKEGGGQADITDGGTFVPGAGTATAHFNLTGAAVGTYDVKVHNTSGYGVCIGCFTVTAANPSIDHADPNAVGQGASGVTVHIIGSNFQSGALVTFGGSGITKDSTTFINSGEIDVLLHVSSSAPTGTVSITILNPDGGTTSCANCFKVNPKPSIISASPSPAPNTAGTTLTLTGSNFETDGTATLSKTGQPDITGSNWTDNNPGTNPGDNTSLSIDFPITNAAPGVWVLTIFNIDGGSATCSNCVTISAATPTVTSTSPASLPRGSTAVDVTVVGTSFAHGAVASFSDSDITVNSTTWVDATHVKANVTIPSGAAVQSSDVTVTNTDGNSGHCTGCFSVTLLAPVVSSVSPSSGHEGQTLNVTVIGSNFVSTPTVTFTGGGINKNSTTWVDANHVTVNITIDPAADVSARDVTLQNPDGQSDTCSACFNVTLPAPTATSVTPSTGHQGTTLDVIVNGSNFVSGAAVTFPGSADITVNSTTFQDAGHLKANITIDPSAAPTARNVKVTNPDTQTVTCPSCFTVTLPAPTATSATPSMGERGSTIDVTIAGTNFVNGAIASFSGGNITVNSTTFVDSSHVKANITIGSGAATTVRDVTVTNPDSQSATCIGCFTVVATTTVTFTTPSTLTAPIVATFSQDVGGVTTSNFVFGVTGSGTNLAGTLACKDGSNASTSCGGTTVRSAWLTPTARLVPGQHYTATVNPTGAALIVDGAGAPVTSASVSFRGSLVQEESSLAASYLWRAVANSHALGGTYTTEHFAGASASYTFSGTTVRWYTMLGPNQGTAHVYIDGGSFGRVNNYRSTTVFGAYWTFSGLASGTHTLLIVVDGLKGSTNGTGTLITVDGMKPGTGAVQSSPSVAYKWRNASYSAATGGHYAQADLAGASVFFTFRGTRLDWYTVFGQYDGKANVYIDGTLRGTVDTYRSSTATGRIIFTGLSDATHVIRIIVTGTKQTASRGTNIIIDRFVVF